MTALLPNPSFWAGKRVLLTGHTGFKGSWTALWLSRLGAHVTGFALAPDAGPSLFNLAAVADCITSNIGDLRDEQAVARVVEKANPEIVIHMAAQPIVRSALADPVETIATNVLGSAHLLQALRHSNVLKGVLVVTSDKVYNNDGQRKFFKESDKLGGKDPYSASKAATELITSSFAQSYFSERGVAVLTARGGNVVGGGDYATDRIVPDIVRAVNSGEMLKLRMPDATRPWQHVLDCVCGYLVYVEAVVLGKILPTSLNFGPQSNGDVTVGALASAMLSALGWTRGWDYTPEVTSREMTVLAVDSSAARIELGWQDHISGCQLVKWTADWYKSIADGRDARQTTLAQIDDYLTLCRIVHEQ